MEEGFEGGGGVNEGCGGGEVRVAVSSERE